MSAGCTVYQIFAFCAAANIIREMSLSDSSYIKLPLSPEELHTQVVGSGFLLHDKSNTAPSKQGCGCLYFDIYGMGLGLNGERVKGLGVGALVF